MVFLMFESVCSCIGFEAPRFSCFGFRLPWELAFWGVIFCFRSREIVGFFWHFTRRFTGFTEVFYDFTRVFYGVSTFSHFL